MTKQIKSLGLFSILAVSAMLVLSTTKTKAFSATDYQCDASTKTTCTINGVGSGSGALKPASPTAE